MEAVAWYHLVTIKMRLKIYICTDEDVERGECDRCQSEGCYYQGEIIF